MARTKPKAVQLTQKELKALVAGRTDQEIGVAVRKMLEPHRRRKELDLDVLVKMRMAGCTIPELAAEMGVSVKTLDNRLREDPLFRDMYERGEGRGRAAVRMAQFRKAVVDKDTGMLIWQGKQRLGQKDRQEIGGEWVSLSLSYLPTADPPGRAGALARSPASGRPAGRRTRRPPRSRGTVPQTAAEEP